LKSDRGTKLLNGLQLSCNSYTINQLQFALSSLTGVGRFSVGGVRIDSGYCIKLQDLPAIWSCSKTVLRSRRAARQTRDKTMLGVCLTQTLLDSHYALMLFLCRGQVQSKNGVRR